MSEIEGVIVCFSSLSCYPSVFFSFGGQILEENLSSLTICHVCYRKCRRCFREVAQIHSFQ